MTTTWVLLRGLAREARHWGDFPAILGEAFPDADILTPDLPGNGRRYREPSPTRVADMVAAVRRELREQGRAPPYHLLALSLGGMVAVDWALRHPRECRAAVLINTSMRPHNPFYQRLRPAAWPTLPHLLAAGDEAREQAILELTSARAAELAGVLPAWLGYARTCPVSRRNTLRQLLAAARFSAREQPAIPLLILAGAADCMVNPSCSQRLAQAWNAEFHRHPGAGHDLPLDAGEWLAQVVRAWLAAPTGVESQSWTPARTEPGRS
jgi:pimeloyl-ACP methyl ester carboxylesterase